MALVNPMQTSDVIATNPVSKSAFGDKVINNLNGLDTRSVDTDTRLADLGNSLNAADTNLASRLSLLERSFGGVWRASNTLQDIPQSAGNDIAPTQLQCNTVVTSPAGIVNNNNGTWTITQAGWWNFSGIFDIDMSAIEPHQWVLVVAGPNGTIAADQFYWTTGAWTSGNAFGSDYLQAGSVVTFTGVHYSTAGVARTYRTMDAARTKFLAQWTGP